MFLYFVVSYVVFSTPFLHFPLFFRSCFPHTFVVCMTCFVLYIFFKSVQIFGLLCTVLSERRFWALFIYFVHFTYILR